MSEEQKTTPERENPRGKDGVSAPAIHSPRGLKEARWYKQPTTASLVILNQQMLALAKDGDEEAMAAIGNAHYRAKEYDHAAYWYLGAATLNHVGAQTQIGKMYIKGQGGIGQSMTEAERWLTKAAEKEDAEAQYNLGMLHFSSNPSNPSEAVKWYREAARKDHVAAQRELGLLYMEGEGVKQSYAQARRYLKRAVDKGDVLAERHYDRVKKAMERPSDQAAGPAVIGSRAAEELKRRIRRDRGPKTPGGSVGK